MSEAALDQIVISWCSLPFSSDPDPDHGVHCRSVRFIIYTRGRSIVDRYQDGDLALFQDLFPSIMGVHGHSLGKCRSVYSRFYMFQVGIIISEACTVFILLKILKFS